MQISSATARVIRGWVAASVCTWTAFAAHAQATPTITSVLIMLLITCVSAVIAMAVLGGKFSLFSTSLVVVFSQLLYHLAFSVMSHSGSHLVPTTGSGIHAHHVTALSMVHGAATSEPNLMISAHLYAAVVSIFILRQGERLVSALADVLSLATVCRILTVLSRTLPVLPKTVTRVHTQQPLCEQNRPLLPLLRGPPSPVLISA